MDVEKKVEQWDADVVLDCSFLQGAQDFYIDELQFRLDTVFPADSPRVAFLQGHGITLALQQMGATMPAEPVFQPTAVVQRLIDNVWATGRAGMQYRDLIPNRLGGKYIASHIRIESGGHVPDYVHFHEVHFQLIYCYKGWVRVVYEDQGSSFIMRPGDCVLQPPQIRHRVLECSDAMEVVEIACPAEHMTGVDHELLLPTQHENPNRYFSGQRFVCLDSASATWVDSPVTGFLQRDTGIAAASNGIASAMVLRSNGDSGDSELIHGGELFFVFIVCGSANLRSDASSGFDLCAGDAFVVAPDQLMALGEKSSDLMLLLVTACGS